MQTLSALKGVKKLTKPNDEEIKHLMIDLPPFPNFESKINFCFILV